MIFNEYERASEIDEKQKFSVDIMRDGILLARFYKTNGLTKEETSDKIWTILSKLDDCFTQKFKEKCLKDIMHGFDHFELMSNEPIYFYKEELDVIQQLENKTTRKVLFALLYIRKASGKDVFEDEQSDINRICIKRIRSEALYKSLYELKVLGFTKYTSYKGRNKTQIIYPALNVKYDSEPVITITNKNNIINYYYRYIGEGKYVNCKGCGKLVPVTSFHVDYCDKCAKKNMLDSKRKYNKKYYKEKIKE